MPAEDKDQPRSSRQGPGAACDECRRRKLRCDRQPTCHNCLEGGVVCTTRMDRSVRGPKKGHLKALKGRIATLERCLTGQQNGSLQALSRYDSDSDDDDDDNTPAEKNAGPRTPVSLLSDPIGGGISELVQEDLDQLYFDRVHPFVPILHRNRYLSWAKKLPKSKSYQCLQNAMRTLAASLSAQAQDTRDSLYHETRTVLESLDSNSSTVECFKIEQAQAWILLALYEFMQISFLKGWMSAGRAFRIIQLMRLYELDAPNRVTNQLHISIQPDWIEMEEKRRTFWMAYTLDRVVNILHGGSLTLGEQTLTRLPMPEAEFQGGQSICMDFLSEAITGGDFTVLQSSFCEYIIQATICGRSLSHRHLSIVEHMYGSTAQDFWSRHEWIDTTLTTRIQILSLNFPPLESIDPMLLFAKMIAQASVLCLYRVIEAVTWDTDQYESLILEYGQRSQLAAQEMVSLAKSLTQLSYLKVHPFTPITLLLCAEFLNTREKDIDTVMSIELQQIRDALKYLRVINILAVEDPTFFFSTDVLRFPNMPQTPRKRLKASKGKAGSLYFYT